VLGVTAAILSFAKGQRTLRPAGTWTAAIDRVRRNIGNSVQQYAAWTSPPPPYAA
jgi:hypothetical protein